jgi:hypothetical protein
LPVNVCNCYLIYLKFVQITAYANLKISLEKAIFKDFFI